MPWHIIPNHSDCPDGRPFAVVKDDDGDVEGCHPTRAAAEDQLAALYASEADQDLAALSEELVKSAMNTDVTMAKPSKGTPADRRLKENKKRKPRTEYESDCPPGMHRMPDGDCMPDDDMAAEMVGPFQGWTGVLAVEGHETGDGREFAEGSLEWPVPPLPLMWQRESEPQHGHSVVVGRIDRIERRNTEILGWGVIDLGNPDGAEVARQMGHDMAGGVSVDVDSVKEPDVELVYPTDSEDERVEEEDDIMMLFGPPPEKTVFHRGRIRGATLVALPAFVEARLRLIDEVEIAAALADVVTASGEYAMTPDATVAAGGPLYPPRAWFQDPKLQAPTPWTVDKDGRVFGHLALWGSCHTTFPNRCITPPRERDFPYFMKRELETDDGELIGIGSITMGTGHAPLNLGQIPAAEHYDNTGAAAVDITVGEDRWGIWVAGSLRPGLNDIRLRELRAASLSGDWRRIGGRLRLVAVLAVNVPGYPIPKMRATLAADEVASLVAAGIPTEARRERYRYVNANIQSDGTIRVRRANLVAGRKEA